MNEETDGPSLENSTSKAGEHLCKQIAQQILVSIKRYVKKAGHKEEMTFLEVEIVGR